MKGNYIYMLVDKQQIPLYIGMSKNLTTRIMSNHFGSKKGNLDEKCLYETNQILYHLADSVDDMKIKERYFINTLNPKYNKHFNNSKKFSYEIEVDWNILEVNINELLERRKSKISRRTINHVCDIKSNLFTWLPYGVDIKTRGKNYLIIKPDFELMGVDTESNYDTNTYFIKVNGELYIHNFHFLSYFTANYKMICLSYGLDKKTDFLSVICPVDGNLFKRFSDVIIESEVKQDVSVPFMSYKAIKRNKLLDTKILKYLEDNLSVEYKRHFFKNTQLSRQQRETFITHI